MKFQIKKRFSDEIIYEGEANSFIEFVERHKANLSEANLYKANLYKANLSEANLYKANLSEADLSEANLYKAKIKITQKEEIIKALKIIVKE